MKMNNKLTNIYQEMSHDKIKPEKQFQIKPPLSSNRRLSKINTVIY